MYLILALTLLVNESRLEIPPKTIFSYSYELYPDVLRDCILKSTLINLLIAPSLIYYKRLVQTLIIDSTSEVNPNDGG